MSTNKTENLGLHSWVRSDPFRMDEFNENVSKIDKAVGGKAEQSELDRVDAAAVKFACDIYTGDGRTDRFIELGFTPKVVFVGCGPHGQFYITNNAGYFGGVAMRDNPAHSGTLKYIEIVENGFLVSAHGSGSSSWTANHNNGTYLYFAIG